MLRCSSIRPIFLGSCIVTCKLTRDSNVQLPDLHCRLTDVFNLLEVRHLVLLEHQLLEVRHASVRPSTSQAPVCTDLPPLPQPVPELDRGRNNPDPGSSPSPHQPVPGQVLHWRFPTGSVLQAYADAIFRTAGDELARRAQGNALAHPTLVHLIPAPQVLAPWPLPKSPADRFRAAAHIQRHARGMATRSGLALRAPGFAAIFACEPRAACHAAPAA